MNEDLDPWLQMIPQSTLEKALNPSAEALGKGAGGIMSALMFYPRKLGIYTEYQLLKYQNELAEEIGQIPEENRDSTKKGLAIKTLEDSVYQLDIDELRKMFTTLISSTFDNRKNDGVHPFFSTILKDMNTADAKVFKDIYLVSKIPIVSVTVHRRLDNSYMYLTEFDLLLDENTFIDDANPSINLLNNFGLISINRETPLVSEKYQKRYAGYENSKYYQFVRESNKLIFGDENSYSTRIEKGYIQLTDLGTLFGKAVINDQ